MAAIKQINNSFLFANIATVTASLKYYRYDSDKIVPIALYCIFFVFFRFKAYLDDNRSINDSRESRKSTAGESEIKPTLEDMVSAIASIASWCMYTVSGFYVLIQVNLSQRWLLSSLITFNVLIVIIAVLRWKQDDGNKLSHAIYFSYNCLYILILGVLQSQCFESSASVLCIILLITLVLDYIMSKSLNNIYIPYS